MKTMPCRAWRAAQSPTPPSPPARPRAAPTPGWGFCFLFSPLSSRVFFSFLYATRQRRRLFILHMCCVHAGLSKNAQGFGFLCCRLYPSGNPLTSRCMCRQPFRRYATGSSCNYSPDASAMAKLLTAPMPGYAPRCPSLMAGLPLWVSSLHLM
jgi:hypothetical protein